jgi:sulfur carrier protein ThiS
MKILFINNEGGGFADHIEVPEKTTVLELLQQKIPGRKPEDFLIRVNRLPSLADQVLAEGDRVSITATKIAGACRRC